MKNLVLRALTATMVLTFLFFCHNASVNAEQIIKTLDDNTKMTPPGTRAIELRDIPEFKKGTAVTLNDNGEVIEGILSAAIMLPCVDGVPFYYRFYEAAQIPMANRILKFKENTKVTFNDSGEVVRGTVAGGLLGIPVSKANYISLRDGTEIIFHGNGIPASCTLDFDTYLRPVGWQKNLTAGYTNKINCAGFAEFTGGRQVELNDKGEVTKGTLNKDTKLLSLDGSFKIYGAGTTVEFDENGAVVKAVKPAN